MDFRILFLAGLIPVALLLGVSREIISRGYPQPVLQRYLLILALAAGVLTAGTVHAVKAVAVRPAVTATTAGLGNTPVSILEDIAATVVSILAIVIPILIFVILLLILALLVWFFWRKLKPARTT